MVTTTNLQYSTVLVEMIGTLDYSVVRMELELSMNWQTRLCLLAIIFCIDVFACLYELDSVCGIVGHPRRTVGTEQYFCVLNGDGF